MGMDKVEQRHARAMKILSENIRLFAEQAGIDEYNPDTVLALATLIEEHGALLRETAVAAAKYSTITSLFTTNSTAVSPQHNDNIQEFKLKAGVSGVENSPE
jgi:hypothetical protein